MPRPKPEIKVTLERIKEARDLINKVILNTPLVYSEYLSHNDVCNCQVYLKLENFQKTGAYKLRGAYNKIAQLPEEERRRGVITASAGNHAQGVAYAARELDIAEQTHIIMSTKASEFKQLKTKLYGVKVELHGKTFDQAYAYAQEQAIARNKTLIPPYDDWDIIAGQGTIALEILEHPEGKDADVIVVPVGGGGLISGIAIAAKAINPDIRIVGVEAQYAAPFIYSLDRGRPTKLPDDPSTIADGIAVGKPGRHTYTVVEKLVRRPNIVTVPDEAIAQAMLDLAHYANLVTEGAGAAGVAAVRRRVIKGLDRNTKVVVIVSGGNIHQEFFTSYMNWILKSDRYLLEMRVPVENKPGVLAKLTNTIKELGINVSSVELLYWHRGKLGSVGTIADLVLEINTKDDEKENELMEKLKNCKPKFNPEIIGRW